MCTSHPLAGILLTVKESLEIKVLLHVVCLCDSADVT